MRRYPAFDPPEYLSWTPDPEAMTAFLADKLSALEMPKQIEFRSSLPKTAVGKISKKDLLAEGTLS